MNIAIEARHAGHQPTGLGAVATGLVQALSHQRTGLQMRVYVPRNSALHQVHLPASVQLVSATSESGSRFRQVWWQHVSMPRDARRHGAELFHATSYVLPLRCKLPGVVTVHDVIALTHPQFCPRLNSMHFRMMLPRSIRTARAVIVPTAAVRDRIVRLLGTRHDKIHVVPHGIEQDLHHVDDPDELDRLRRRYDLPQRFVLFIGTLEPKKNLETLLDAWPEVRRRHPEVGLVLAGKRGWRCPGLFRRLDEHDVHDGIQWTGYVRPQDKAALLSAAHMLVMPSHVEGFGLPVPEAMACGTPVVTSRDPALVEVGGDAALSVETECPAELAEAMHQLLKDDILHHDMVDRGLDRAARFSWSRAARSTLDIYKTILD